MKNMINIEALSCSEHLKLILELKQKIEALEAEVARVKKSQLGRK